MLRGDRQRPELAYSLQLTMPGTPVIRYGDEIGMGENLELPEREAVRTPMQWSNSRNAGFSGPYGYARVNVTDQRRDPDSMRVWLERMLHTLRECEEIGTGEHEIIDCAPSHVLVHKTSGERGSMLFLHNLPEEPCRISVPAQPDEEHALNIASDHPYPNQVDISDLELGRYGYRWIRLRRNP